MILPACSDGLLCFFSNCLFYVFGLYTVCRSVVVAAIKIGNDIELIAGIELIAVGIGCCRIYFSLCLKMISWIVIAGLWDNPSLGCLKIEGRKIMVKPLPFH